MEGRKEHVCFFSHPHGLGCLNEPMSVNSVNVRRYRHVIEPVDEPVDVICERLEKLWVECRNWHMHEMFLKEAKRYGYEFRGQFGEKAKKP